MFRLSLGDFFLFTDGGIYRWEIGEPNERGNDTDTHKATFGSGHDFFSASLHLRLGEGNKLGYPVLGCFSWLLLLLPGGVRRRKPREREREKE